MSQRIGHGSTLPAEVSVEKNGLEISTHTAANFATESILVTDSSVPATLPTARAPIPFNYLFPELQEDPSHRLPRTPQTLINLALLGASMQDAGEEPGTDSSIPAAYTYFGQFLAHDMVSSNLKKQDPTLTDSCMLDEKELVPFTRDEVTNKVHNNRTSILELECVYGSTPPPEDSLMKLGEIELKANSKWPIGKDRHFDLPRGQKSEIAKEDRVAQISDKRNDENLIVSQLHVAFLRAHNSIVTRLRATALVEPADEFREARKLLRQHYQWIVIHDFLKTIADPDIVDAVLAGPNLPFAPTANALALPHEFAVAAFRFGHSMIRSSYYYNDEFPVRPLQRLYTLTALSNALKPTPNEGSANLREDKIIKWEEFLAGGRNRARKIDTRLVEPLFEILDEANLPMPCDARLAVQDLKRGFMLRMPTGQAVATRLHLPVMSPTQILSVAANKAQKGILSSSGFLDDTPLWFYLLAEAAYHKKGDSLGPVGSRLVAEVLVGLVRSSKDSFLDPDFHSPGPFPFLGTTPGEFTLKDLLLLAGVMH